MSQAHSRCTVIVTRPQPANDNAAAVYQRAGFDVLSLPVFDIVTNDSVNPDWLHLHADVWVVLSVNALQHALKIDPKLKPVTDTQVIAVGPAVKQAWEQHFEHPIEYHPLMNSEGVIELLQKYKPQAIKTLTTANGRQLIKNYCMNNSISYTQINTYLRVPVDIDLARLETAYQNSESILLTATSQHILQAFVSQLNDELLTHAQSSAVVVGAPRIADLAQELGFKDVHVATSPSDEHMLQMVQKITVQ